MKVLYSAGDTGRRAAQLHMLGAFTYGWFAGHNAVICCRARVLSALDAGQIEKEKAGLRPAGSQACPPAQVEYKLRRSVTTTCNRRSDQKRNANRLAALQRHQA